MKQVGDESIDTYVTRLREAASRCSFHDKNREIKDQIVFSCISDSLRRKSLRDNMDLDTLIKHTRALEMSDRQAKTI